MNRFIKRSRKPTPDRKATIRDVALRASVAVGTVSRVLNDYADVNETLRERVMRAAEDLNYHPNARGRSLARNSSALLSFILSNRDFLHPFHSHVLQGVQEFCEEMGYFVMFTRFRYSPSVKRSEIHLPLVLQNHGMTDCVLLAGTNYQNFIDALDSRDIPYVLLANNFVADRVRKPVNQVRFDDAGGASEATRYLIELGHEHIWYIGDTSVPWYKIRHQAYFQEMQKAGLQPNAQTLALADDMFMNGLKSVEAILEAKAPLTAIFAGTDDVAFGAWEGLRRHGLSVPRDVSLLGFDDQHVPALSPSLTTVRVDTGEVGRELARMAITKLTRKRDAVPEVLVATKLMKRETCRPLLKMQSPKLGLPSSE